MKFARLVPVAVLIGSAMAAPVQEVERRDPAEMEKRLLPLATLIPLVGGVASVIGGLGGAITGIIGAARNKRDVEFEDLLARDDEELDKRLLPLATLIPLVGGVASVIGGLGGAVTGIVNAAINKRDEDIFARDDEELSKRLPPLATLIPLVGGVASVIGGLGGAITGIVNAAINKREGEFDEILARDLTERETEELSKRLLPLATLIPLVGGVASVIGGLGGAITGIIGAAKNKRDEEELEKRIPPLATLIPLVGGVASVIGGLGGAITGIVNAAINKRDAAGPTEEELLETLAVLSQLTNSKRAEDITLGELLAALTKGQ